MCPEEYEAPIEAAIRSDGITPYPTACALPIQGTVVARSGRAPALRRAPQPVAPAADYCRGPTILDLQGPGWIG